MGACTNIESVKRLSDGFVREPLALSERVIPKRVFLFACDVLRYPSAR